MKLTPLRVFIMLILSVTASGLLVWRLASAVSAPSINSVCAPGACGQQGQPCFYDLYVDPSGPTYLAANGLSGDNTYSSTNPVTTFQNAVNDIVTNHGKVCVRNGPWPFGTNQVTVTGTNSNWTIYFATGAWVTYSGSSFAFQITAASRGSIKDFTIDNPFVYVTSNNGGALEINGGYQFQVTNPHITTSGIGIQFDNLNTAKIINGGTIQNVNNVRGAGTVGIELAGNPTISKATVQNIEIDMNQISGFQYGVMLGCYDATLTDCASTQISVHDTYISSNVIAIQVFSINNLQVRSDYFEADTFGAFNVTNVSGNAPSIIYIVGNYFTETAGVFDINVPGGATTNQIQNTWILANSLGAGKITLNGAIVGVTLDVTGSTGTIVLNSGGGNSIRVTFNPDPQIGKVTGVSTAAATLVTGSVTFSTNNRAYPSGIGSIRVTLQLDSPSDATARYTGLWVSSVSNTGFTWNLAVSSPGAGGSTVTIDWQATIGIT